MSFVLSSSESFPKAHRLLKRRDFQFRPYKRFQTEKFNFIYTQKGTGRLGISISKKVLRRAVARNRIRRLLRETFRLRRDLVSNIDIHVVGLSALTETWSGLHKQDIDTQSDAFIERLAET